MPNFDNLIEALDYFKSIGYTTDFNLAYDHLVCKENLLRLHPSSFEIMETVRFDGNTDPGEESVLYAVQSKDGLYKGTLVSAFGIYADAISKDLLDKLSFHTIK